MEDALSTLCVQVELIGCRASRLDPDRLNFLSSQLCRPKKKSCAKTKHVSRASLACAESKSLIFPAPLISAGSFKRLEVLVTPSSRRDKSPTLGRRLAARGKSRHETSKDSFNTTDSRLREEGESRRERETSVRAI